VTLSIAKSTSADKVEVAPTGEIDVENAFMIKDAVQEVLAEGGARRIELDMRGVTFIDSVGISGLVSAHQLAAVSGVRVIVTRPSRFAHRQLWVTGLLGLFGNPDPAPDTPGPAQQPAVSGA